MRGCTSRGPQERKGSKLYAPPMPDGVRNGGNVYAGYIDPRQSETYLSVRKILVHKMMPSEPTPSDGAIQEPSFSHVVNSVNESLD